LCKGLESPIRGETFVTRKVTRALARIKTSLQEILYVGNLDARRDWGHARDYVRMMWMMLQQPESEDYVVATGHQHSVRDLIETAAGKLDIRIAWEGKGIEEKGINAATGKPIVAIDPRYFRPAEVDTLLGDPSKARRKFGWEPRISFEELVTEMITADLKEAEKDTMVQQKGYRIYGNSE
jgi:GDPmannose 4,6-dehydratase